MSLVELVVEVQIFSLGFHPDAPTLKSLEGGEVISSLRTVKPHAVTV